MAIGKYGDNRGGNKNILQQIVKNHSEELFKALPESKQLRDARGNKLNIEYIKPVETVITLQ